MELPTDYEVRLWCESGDIVAYATVSGKTVDYYTDHYETTERCSSVHHAELSAQRWIKEQPEYGTEGYSVQTCRHDRDVSSDPTEF